MEKKILLALAAILFTAGVGCAGNAAETELAAKKPSKKQDSAMSFIIMGDVHYCDEKFYDLGLMESEKPGDHRQITKTYAPVTSANWNDQMDMIRQQVRNIKPDVKCVVQLGDVSEGIANSDGMAAKMAENVTAVLRDARLGVPWVLAKGNHDITGFSDYRAQARAAFVQYYTPFIVEQTGTTDIDNANYTWRTGDVLFVMLDAYNNDIDQTEFARKALSESDAKYKFVCMHEPAIPATERCWHFLRSKPAAERNEFLKVLAENGAIVLCGHLHRYSVLRRDTEYGPIVQIMATSVTNLRRTAKATYQKELADYAGLVDWKPDYQPATLDQRREMIRAEAPYISYYKMNNLAGYGVISIEKNGHVILRYYSAFSDTPADEVDITELQNRK